MIEVMKKLLLLLLPIVAVACTPDPVVEKGVEVKFKASIKSMTKAMEDKFAEGDEICVFATEANLDNCYASNVNYYFDGLYFISDDPVRYPDADTRLDFYAVYPEGYYRTPNFSFDVESDQRKRSDYEKSDLMIAYKGAVNEETVSLSFRHMFTSVVVDFKPEILDASIEYIDLFAKAEVDLEDNSCTNDGSRVDIKAYSDGSGKYKVILPPQKITNKDSFAQITIGGEQFEWKLESDLILSSNTEYSFTLEIKDEVVMVASEINPWEDVDGDGTAILK